MKPAIHQLVAGYQRGDAISNNARLLQRILRGWGHRSEIYCERRRTAPEQRGEVRPMDQLAADCAPRDFVLLHLSIGCRANALFPTLPCRKLLLYHNITPPEYFARLNPSVAAELAEGRRQAATLAGTAELNLADSAFNAGELRGMGYASADVLPLMLDLRQAHRAAAPEVLERFGDGLANLLFVGRIVPNKRHDSLLRVFHEVQRSVEPRSRLVLVGSHQGAEAYHTLLLGAAHALELPRVVFTGTVSQAALTACYRTAAAFVCMSEHEGFCAPLLEAMHHRVPVMALDAAAVGETLGGAGVLFRELDPPLMAETIGRILHDPALRQSVLERQQRRLEAYLGRDFDAELRTALAPALDRRPPAPDTP